MGIFQKVIWIYFYKEDKHIFILSLILDSSSCSKHPWSMATHVVPFKMGTENRQEIKFCRFIEHCLTFDVNSFVNGTSLGQCFCRYYQKLMNSSIFRVFCLKSWFTDLWLGISSQQEENKMFLFFFFLTKFYGALTFSGTY